MMMTVILALSLTYAWRLLLTQQYDTDALSLDGCGFLESMEFSMLPIVGGTTAHLRGRSERFSRLTMLGSTSGGDDTSYGSSF